MKAIELRKGNIVDNKLLDILKKGHVEMEARWIYEMAVKESAQEYNWYVDFFEPISLTEEWFIMFNFSSGFTSDPQEPNPSKVFTKHILDIHMPNMYTQEFIFSTYRGDTVYIKYVHQLQNIYHSLTNNELQLKLQ